MANKHMTDGSASLVIRKMQIKATTIFLDAHPGAAGMTKPDDPRCRQSECSLAWDREQKAAVRPSLSTDRRVTRETRGSGWQPGSPGSRHYLPWRPSGFACASRGTVPSAGRNGDSVSQVNTNATWSEEGHRCSHA